MHQQSKILFSLSAGMLILNLFLVPPSFAHESLVPAAAASCFSKSNERDFKFKDMERIILSTGPYYITNNSCSGGVHLVFTQLQRVTSVQVESCFVNGKNHLIGPLITFRKDDERKLIASSLRKGTCFLLVFHGSGGIPPRYTVQGHYYY